MRLFCFGFGYSAAALAGHLSLHGFTVTGTSRSEAGCLAIEALGHEAVRFDGAAPMKPGVLEGNTHVLVSVPPGANGDPVLRWHATDLAALAKSIAWLGYLSTTGVYGDHGGGLVDENSTLQPTSARGQRRLVAENRWLDLHRTSGLPLHIFRLAGIYGPGRNPFEALQRGTARRVVKPGQVFSRIHVDDVAGVLEASVFKPHPGRVYNLADDEPAPPQDVVLHAATLLAVPPPPEIPFDKAPLSAMARSFYGESKRVNNRRIKDELGYELRYRSYREGLAALKTRP